MLRVKCVTRSGSPFGDRRPSCLPLSSNVEDSYLVYPFVVVAVVVVADRRRHMVTVPLGAQREAEQMHVIPVNFVIAAVSWLYVPHTCLTALLSSLLLVF